MATTYDHRAWHPHHAACRTCAGTNRPHHSDGRCVDCVRGRPQVEVVPLDPKGEKRCSKCKRLRPIRAFWARSNRASGLRSACKTCTRKQRRGADKRRYEREREVIRAYIRAIAPVRNAELRARYRENLAENREINRIKSAEYRAKNREKVNAWRRARYAVKKAQQQEADR